jgi:hypothetical protein
MNAYKYQRGEAVGFMMFLLAVFLLVAVPYMQAGEDRKNLKELKDGYRAFLAYGEEERLRGLGFDITLEGVYEGEGRLGGNGASITYEFKDGVVIKTLETTTEEFTGKAVFVQNGPEVSYSLVEGDSDLFPSTPEIFVATPDGKVYSAFSRASMEHIPAAHLAAEKEQADAIWGMVKNISTALIAVVMAFIAFFIFMGMYRRGHRRH